MFYTSKPASSVTALRLRCAFLAALFLFPGACGQDSDITAPTGPATVSARGEASLATRNSRLARYGGRGVLVRQTLSNGNSKVIAPISRFSLAHDAAKGAVRLVADRQSVVDCKTRDNGDGTASMGNCLGLAQWDPYADTTFIETISETFTAVASSAAPSTIPEVPESGDSIGVSRIIVDSTSIDDSMLGGIGFRRDGHVVGMVFQAVEGGPTAVVSTDITDGLLTALVVTVTGEDSQEVVIEVALEGYGEALRMQSIPANVSGDAYQKSLACLDHLVTAAKGVLTAGGSAIVMYYSGGVIRHGMKMFVKVVGGNRVKLQVTAIVGENSAPLSLAAKMLTGAGILDGLQNAYHGTRDYIACN